MSDALMDMDGDDVGSVIAALDCTNRHIADLFGVTDRTVYRWKVSGPPPHVAIVMDRLVNRRRRVLPKNLKRTVERMLNRIGRSRRDGNRYR